MRSPLTRVSCLKGSPAFDVTEQISSSVSHFFFRLKGSPAFDVTEQDLMLTFVFILCLKGSPAFDVTEPRSMFDPPQLWFEG